MQNITEPVCSLDSEADRTGFKMEETDLLPTHRCLQERLGSLLPFTLPVKIQVLNLSTLFGSVMCQIYVLKELTAYSVRSLIEKDSVTPPTKVKIIPNLNLVSVPFEVFQQFLFTQKANICLCVPNFMLTLWFEIYSSQPGNSLRAHSTFFGHTSTDNQQNEMCLCLLSQDPNQVKGAASAK